MAVVRDMLVLVIVIISIDLAILEEEEELQTKIHEWTTTAKNTIWESSQTAHRVLIGMTDIDFKGKNASRTLKRIAKFSSRIAGVMGVAGAVLSVILEFTAPEKQDSEELKYMTSEFGKLLQQMDDVSRSIDDVKGLIKLESQKTAYIQDENKINNGQENLVDLINKVKNVSCTGQIDCRRKKITAAHPYVEALNVGENVKNIWTGAISERAFGNSLLSLLQEESLCNTEKINRYVNRLTALIIKGMTVSMVYGLLKVEKYNYMDDAIHTANYLSELERKRRGIETACFSKADYWISNDVEDSYGTFTSDSKETNKKLVQQLELKYPWVDWQVITCQGNYTPVIGPKDSFYSMLVSSSKEKKMHAIVIPTTDGKVRDKIAKTTYFRDLVDHIFYKKLYHRNLGFHSSSDSKEIDDVLTHGFDLLQQEISKDAVLDGEVQTIAIVPGEHVYLGYYRKNADGNDTLEQHELSRELHNNHLMMCRHYHPSNDSDRTHNYGFAVSFKIQTTPCVKSCGKGNCDFLPHSTEMTCNCEDGFSGDRCQESEQDIYDQFAIFSVYSKAISMTMPSLLSLRNTLEETKLFLTSSLTNIEVSISKAEESISGKINEIEYYMTNKFEWWKVMMRYQTSIDRLKYFQRMSNWFSSHGKNNSTLPVVDRFAIEHNEIATYILSPIGVKKWLYHLNFLIVGRYRDVLNSHKPIVFMVMDNLRDRVCYADYKVEVDQTLQQLNLLQVQGFSMWIHALHLLGRDSTAVAKQFAMVQDAQTKFLEENTCHVNVPNSVNLQNCSGYIHPHQHVDVLCKEGYYLDGKCYVLCHSLYNKFLCIHV